MVPLVLAGIEPGQIIGIVVLVISVLSWIVNVIQGNTPDGTPRPKKPKPRAEKSEIEVLLEELTDKRKPRPEERQAERSRPKQKPVSQRPPIPQPPIPVRSAARISETKLPSSNLGSSVRTHQLGNRVEAAVQQEITAAVQHDLGNRISAAVTGAEQPVHPLVKVLRDPIGVRQAILLNEILQRPQSRRRGS